MTELAARPLHASGGTLGGQIARQIEHDIRVNGWREGHLIASEAELISKHGVGVAAVREAVRILEARGLARTRRGPGGGLLVTAPDRRLVTDAARRHLEHAGVDRAELFEVWLALEQLAVTRLATSIDPAGAQRLRAVLRKEDERQLAETWEDLPNVHLEIAKLAGNRALELFIEVLTEMSINQYGIHTSPHTMVAWLHAQHVELVEAIIAGDAPMAALHLRRLTEQLARPEVLPDN